ncbi:MAG TPA: phage tail protein [Candidatus Bilophila faecipullorum]|mgnify:CR=1 FL=1|uniref:Phage tail protein n=1 Tax=Candidatus Bilophila faecipullorum TaxID=2838482 RepID=A0A9D1R3Y0_9BACT|nr:phage tail protein [Candidatus Bilophila faecipullorum]
MTIPQMYMHDLITGEYTGSRDATQRPNGEYILEATGATSTPPPADIPVGHIARWTGEVWETVEDHRQHMDERGRKEGGTPYWLSGDTWCSEPRYTEDLGPLPAGALLERPERPFSELRAEKMREIDSGYSTVFQALVVESSSVPSAAVVAADTMSLSADDPQGFEYVRTMLAARRAELLAQVEAASMTEDRAALAAIVVSYPS